MEDNGRTVQIRHVKAHRKLRELDQDDPEVFRVWLGNEVADHLAGMMGEEIQVSDDTAEGLV